MTFLVANSYSISALCSISRVRMKAKERVAAFLSVIIETQSRHLKVLLHKVELAFSVFALISVTVNML
jgi:hypothetical protein